MDFIASAAISRKAKTVELPSKYRRDPGAEPRPRLRCEEPQRPDPATRRGKSVSLHAMRTVR